MNRPDALRLTALVVLAAVVLGGLLLFHIRVRIAGFKYLLLLAGVLAFAWWIGSRRR